MTPISRGAAAMRAEMERYWIIGANRDDWAVLSDDTREPLFCGLCHECQAWIDERAFAAGQEAMWQPIETAPRDGMWILACRTDHYLTNGFTPIPVYFGEYHPNSKGDRIWRDNKRHRVNWLTHWQSLPPPPAGAAS